MNTAALNNICQKQSILYVKSFQVVIRLGKLALYHCDECNIPLLKRSYDGKAARHVAITPPGDVRPAFDFDVAMLEKLLKKQFGSAYLPPVILLNSIPAIDRSDEVIIDGRVAGVLYYDIFRQSFYFQPRPWYASLLEIKKGYVVADDGAVDAILKTSNLMGPGVVSVDGGIKEGDEVIVLNKDWEVVATGKARKNADEMKSHGMAVKIKWRGIEKAEKREKITWKDVIEANEDVISSYVGEAKKFIERFAERSEKKVISFSGGKDSLATLLLALEAGYEFPMMFLNTGIEFDETVEYVHDVASRHSVELFEESAGDAFWRGIKVFGPPSRDYRWCCKTCKLGPAVRLIKKHFGGSVISFIGQRRYESENRAKHGSIWQNPWVRGQIAVSPIQNWTALHIWLYLFMKKARWNRLYEQGFYRIGCWLCPSSSMADFAIKKHADWERFEKELRAFKEKQNLPEEWLSLGLWRWRRPPRWSKVGYEVTTERKYEIKGNEKRIENFLNILGRVEKLGKGYRAGRFEVSLDRLEENEKIVNDVIYKAIKCIGCGVCLTHCPRDAIYIDANKAWIDANKCIHCRECMKECPVVVFG